MAKCDLCGADCRANEMEQLHSIYQVSGVSDLCPDCSKWANKLKGKMLAEITPRIREAIAERKGRPSHALKKWWQRLIGVKLEGGEA